MPCFHPIVGYRVPGGQVKTRGSGPWTERLTIACGQCVGCGAERQRQWGVRGMHELAMTIGPDRSTRASFLTLTYSDANLPENGILRLRDWQLFAKRLRRRHGRFRFLMCGEYGSEDHTERCHFHAVLFGIDFREDRTKIHKTPKGHQLFISPALDAAWGLGIHTIGNVSFDSVSYVAGYINKQVRGEEKKEHYQRLNTETGELYDQVPEFGTMSRNPGLGAKWIEKYHPEVYPADEVIVNGAPGVPPAYYDRWYAKHFPTAWEEVQERRKIKAEKNKADCTPERLAVRERVFKARHNNYKRKTL